MEIEAKKVAVALLAIMLLVVGAYYGREPSGAQRSQTETAVTVTGEGVVKVPVVITTTTYVIGEGGEIIGVRFSPKGNVSGLFIHWIGRANRSVHVLVYSFTLDSIAEALARAKHRGLDVRVVVESAQITDDSMVGFLVDAGVPVRRDSSSGYLHDKVVIIDSLIVITGSYNFSYNAETKNSENAVAIRDVGTATLYDTHFQRLWEAGLEL